MTLEITSNQQFGIGIPEGGIVRWSGDGGVPATFGTTRTGAILGPLELAVPPGTTLDAGEIVFAPEEPSGSGFFTSISLFSAGGAAIGAGALAAASPTETDSDQRTDAGDTTAVTRRGVLGLIGATAVGLLSTRAAADEQVTLSVATIDVEAVDGPFSVRVLDLVDAVLPPTSELLIDHSGTRVGTVASPDERVEMQPETGQVRVYLRDSVSNLTALLAWMRSFVDFDDTIEFSRTFPHGNQASDYEEGSFVTLTEHPAIVGAVDDAGRDATRLVINNTTIPHIDDGTSEAGAWDRIGEGIMYEAGTNPPAEEEWTLQTRLSFTDQLFN